MVYTIRKLNKNLFFAIVFPACIICLLFSCQQQRSSTPFRLSNTDGIFQFPIQNIAASSHVELKIRNTSEKIAHFYITPDFVNLYNDSTILASLLKPYMTDLQKSLALWKFVCEWTYHCSAPSTSDQQLNDPAILVNGFGCSFCDDRNAALANLAEMAGLPSRVYELGGHVVCEIFFDNSWHMFDADKNIFFQKENGEIADVIYLSNHPELVEEKSKELKTVVEKIKNKKTGRAVESPENNFVSEMYKINKSKYTSQITLKLNEQVKFYIEPENFIAKGFYVDIAEKGGPYFRAKGILEGSYNDRHLEKDTDNGPIFIQTLPYPITKITVSADNDCSVFYSTDKVHWYFVGTSKGNSTISFAPFNETGAPYTFIYFLKFSPLSQSGTNSFNIENKFLFSYKILCDTSVDCCQLVPLNEEAKKLDVIFSVIY